MQHLLQTEEIPGRFRGIRSVRRVGDSLERSVEQQSNPHQQDGQDLNRNRGTKEHFGKGLHDLLVGDPHLWRSSASYEHDTPRIFAGVRIHASDEVFGIAQRISFAAEGALFGSLECTYRPPSLRMRQKWIAIKKIAVKGRIMQCRT